MKPGRPEKPASERHTVPVKVYLTDAEKLALSQAAHAVGLGLSEYVRSRVLQYSVQRKAA